MFLIPLLVIFLFSICGGFLFSIILINMGIIDVPPKYGWLNILILAKKRFNKEPSTYHEKELVSGWRNYTVAVHKLFGGGGSEKSYVSATAVYDIISTPLELFKVASAGGPSLGSEYAISTRCDIIACGESEEKLLADVRLVNQGLSAVDSIPIPGGRSYEYKS